MPDIFDYLEWRGDLPFSADPFNEVDNLILAELTYTNFDGHIPEDGTVPLSKVRDEFFATHSREAIRRETNPIHRAPIIMDGMMSGRRFSGVKVSDYADIFDPDKDVQMSAVTYRLEDGTDFVAFRGTDNTVVGWKEDFNMSFLPATGGQRKAAEYLNRIGAKYKRPLRVGGHSKGGNFAVYASAFCDEKVSDRIIEVYTNDGPGFKQEIMEMDAYKRILPKVISIVPDTSIIGMLLTSKVKHRVVSSSGSGLAQHDGMTWQVERNHFVQAEPSELGQFIRKSQVDWLGKLDDRTRETFVNTLFSLFAATGMDTFGEMSSSKFKSAEKIISSMQDLPRERQKEMLRIFGELLSSGKETALASLNERLNRWDPTD